MLKRVGAITAIGTRGKVKGKPFAAISRDGAYVLHSQELASKSGKPLRFAVNQVSVHSLDEAARLLAKGGFSIRVYNEEHKQWNLRTPSEVSIVYR